MILETDVIDRVESYVRHPVFQGSDMLILDVLRDLEMKADALQISRETFQKLRDLIRESPHVREHEWSCLPVSNARMG